MLVRGKVSAGFRTGQILVIQLGDIGDVVLTTPTFRALKETFPDARISALVRTGYGCLLEADPAVSDVIEVRKSANRLAEIGRQGLDLAVRLRRGRYDLVVDLRTGDRGAILAFLTGAPLRVSRHWREGSVWRRLAFNRLIVDPSPAPPPVHPGADQSLRIIRALGADTADTAPRLHLSRKDLDSAKVLLETEGLGDGVRWVTVNPFSRWRYKEWGEDRWPEVIDRLRDRHRLQTLIVGSREEAERVDGISRKCGGGARNIAGRTTLAELAALLSMSVLHIGVDSAAPHIAAAVGTPCVTIFGPSNWKAWVVEDDTHRVARSDMECVPCNNKGCDGTERSICLEELGVDTVMKRIEEVLRNLGSGKG